VAQHSHFVSLIAHALCVIKKKIYNEDVDVAKVITLALYHDSSDAILTHVIAPVKRHESVKISFQKLKGIANNEITRMVPEKMVSEYLAIFQEADEKTMNIVGIADQIDAYCKAKIEVNKGNNDFYQIYEELEKEIQNLAIQQPCVRYFLENFLPSFFEKRLTYRYL
jgi:5'-deoxynucleotidase